MDLWRQTPENMRPPAGMKRLSVFHELPYWKDLLINHLLDPMHIFKNVGSIIWEHITGNRDSKSARDDMQLVGRMRNVWPKVVGDRCTLPKAPWVLSKKDIRTINKEIASFRTPTGYMHCLKGAFTTDGRLSGLKLHDWHKMLQFVLPLVLGGFLHDDVRKAIYKISALVRYVSLYTCMHLCCLWYLKYALK